MNAKPPPRRSIEVVADYRGLRGATPMGTLHATRSRGKMIFEFEYDRDWLTSEHARALDPTLRLFAGPQFAPRSRDSFGLFLDSAPDRWGRVLMARREALRAREQQRAPRALDEVDYLLGVFDGHRVGGIRFRVDGGPFLDDDAKLASPPWARLRELEAASLRLEKAGVEDDPGYGKWLSMLIAPGRSLGGARPKASVVDPQNNLWIAKFPSGGDTHDLGAWEYVLHVLAARAGVTTPVVECKRLGSRHHTFLSRRFDRTASSRIHFASAMTFLDRADGEAGASYLDLADVLIREGAHAARDLEQLWRRIAFNVCVSNVDDHLRNHGFLLEDKGWALAPAYDLNPVATGDGLTLNISETDNAQDWDLVREVAPSFRVTAKRAVEIAEGIRASTREWRNVAASSEISRAEQDQMAEAFRLSA